MKILLHFPHVSLTLPRAFYRELLISKGEATVYNLKMSDLSVDELFKDVEATRMYAKYSRLYCDVEKFRNDEQEVMARYGQGVVYTHAFDGKALRAPNARYRAKVLRYYDRYHRRLDRVATRLLRADGDLLILDCHSFSDEQARSFAKPPFPDVCIGIDEQFYDERIFQEVVSSIKSRGLSYAVNYPYSGSIVPNCFFRRDLKGKVVSLMLEINKRIYL